MILCFELSMPYAASWNGKGSGADQGHYVDGLAAVLGS